MRVFFLCAWVLVGLAQPRVLVPNPIYEFGEIVDGELLCWKFTVENVGNADLILGPVATSCGCTSAPLVRDRLAPGESLSLRVCFDSSGYGGKFVEESASLRTNDPDQPWVRLVLRGYVRPAEPHQGPAKRLLGSLYLLLDVRSPGDYAQGHLLGAVNISISELPRYLHFLPRGLPIFVYGGEESRKAVELLREGKFLAWALAGGIRPHLAPFVVGHLPDLTASEGIPVFPTEALARKYLLVFDLRPPEFFREGTLPGAMGVALENLPVWADLLPHPADLPEGVGYEVWVVDEEGREAAAGALLLREKGIPAIGLVGGLRDWRARFGSAWLIPPFWAAP